MARPSNGFEMAWSSLDAATDEAGWRTIAIEAAGPIAIHAGRRFPQNQESMLVRFPTLKVGSAEKLPDGQGFVVERVDPRGDGHNWLALTRRTDGSTELFSAMVCDVAGALDLAAKEGADEQRTMRSFLGRVRAWQEFMRKGSLVLNAEAEIGLIGELKVLAVLINAGVAESAAVGGWVGPMDGLQDFLLGTGAMEVKTTISATGFIARIVSLDQLDDSILQPLIVAAVRVRQTAGGESLPDIVAASHALVSGDAGAKRELSERLIAAGYLDSQSDRYIRRFELAGVRFIEVGEGFPRLLRGTVPTAVTQALYEIDLDKVPGGSADAPFTLRKLAAI